MRFVISPIPTTQPLCIGRNMCVEVDFVLMFDTLLYVDACFKQAPHFAALTLSDG